jgi:hypothetical protein
MSSPSFIHRQSYWWKCFYGSVATSTWPLPFLLLCAAWLWAKMYTEVMHRLGIHVDCLLLMVLVDARQVTQCDPWSVHTGIAERLHTCSTGAGISVAGGYNVLVAHNTMFRVGGTSHAIAVAFGNHPCASEL